MSPNVYTLNSLIYALQSIWMRRAYFRILQSPKSNYETLIENFSEAEKMFPNSDKNFFSLNARIFSLRRKIYFLAARK